jgi:hypothetical protein
VQSCLTLLSIFEVTEFWLTTEFLVFRKQVREPYSGARNTHHRSNGVPPFGIVRGLFVGLRGCLVAIDLHQNEPGRIVHLLDHIKPGDSWLANAVPRIFERRFNKSIHRFGVHVNVDMNYEHASMFDADLPSCKRGRDQCQGQISERLRIGEYRGDYSASEMTGSNGAGSGHR